MKNLKHVTDFAKGKLYAKFARQKWYLFFGSVMMETEFNDIEQVQHYY